jgi:N6-L-threonylcarbamoyladenine synthase
MPARKPRRPRFFDEEKSIYGQPAADRRAEAVCYHTEERKMGTPRMATRILGIESSCDETAAAVVADGREILSSVVASQVSVHRKYGGVVPELASREHLRSIVPVVREALEGAGLNFKDIDAVGVTQGPGLVGSLLVGLTYGKVLADALGKPLIGVNHLEGHVRAVFLEAFRSGQTPKLPAVCLIVSGGHTVLYEVSAVASRETAAAALFGYRKIGQTRDDAAGEAYDKVAKLVALGYPGGPVIDRLAVHAAEMGRGQAVQVDFSPTKIRGNPYDFSFSGIKTAVLYYLRAHPELQPELEERRRALGRGERTADKLLPLCSPQTLGLLASFQKRVVAELLRRTLQAAEETAAQSILVSGGVAANNELRQSFEREAKQRGTPVFFPSRELSTDNAAMIAAAAYPKLVSGQYANSDLNAEAVLPLA